MRLLQAQANIGRAVVDRHVILCLSSLRGLRIFLSCGIVIILWLQNPQRTRLQTVVTDLRKSHSDLRLYETAVNGASDEPIRPLPSVEAQDFDQQGCR